MIERVGVCGGKGGICGGGAIRLFLFVKQKAAYEMLRSLVGSEMCIRDSYCIFQKWLE